MRREITEITTAAVAALIFTVASFQQLLLVPPANAIVAAARVA